MTQTPYHPNPEFNKTIKYMQSQMTRFEEFKRTTTDMTLDQVIRMFYADPAEIEHLMYIAAHMPSHSTLEYALEINSHLND